MMHDILKSMKRSVLLCMVYINKKRKRFCFIAIDFCLSNPCQNIGTCNSYVGGYNCDCQPDYAGTHCQQGKLKLN